MDDELPPGVELVDLSEQRLKDFARPQHLYQVVAAGLEREFPPLRSEPAAGEPPPARRRRALFVAGAAAAVALAGAATAVRVGAEPGRIAAVGRTAWVALGNKIVAQLDGRRQAVVATVATPDPIYDLALDGDAVVVLTGQAGAAASLARIEPGSTEIASSTRIDLGLSRFGGPWLRPGLAVGGPRLWVTDPYPPWLLRRLDPASLRTTGRVAVGRPRVGSGPALVTDGEEVRVSVGAGSAERVRARDLGIEATVTLPLATGAGAPPAAFYEPASIVRLAAGPRAIWVLTRPAAWCCPPKTSGTATLSRIDRETDSVTATLPLEGVPVDLAVGDGAVWVVNRAGTVFRIDAEKAAVDRRAELRHPAGGLAVAGGIVWAAVKGA